MEQKKIISLPSNGTKIYRQILAVMNFILKLTPQEIEVLAELIKLDNEYEALPQDKRAKFLLSTDMRKEIREYLEIEEKQFNVILSKLRNKIVLGKPLIGENNEIHPEIKVKPDKEGFTVEIHLVNTEITPTQETPPTNTPIPEPVSSETIGEEDSDFEILMPNR
jgi:hypothetical protein